MNIKTYESVQMQLHSTYDASFHYNTLTQLLQNPFSKYLLKFSGLCDVTSCSLVETWKSQNYATLNMEAVDVWEALVSL